MITEQRLKPRQSWEHVLPCFVIAAFWLNAFIYLMIPPVWHVERLWLEWLGRAVLISGTIPHALGSETFTASGAPWVPQEWLFAVIVAAANDGNYNAALNVIMASIGVVPLLLTWIRLRNAGIGVLQTTSALSLLGFCLDYAVQMRAATIGYAGAALIFAALSRKDNRVFVIPLVILVVVNMHASALFLALLPAFALPFCLWDERAFGPASRRMAAVAALSFIATLGTPFGSKLWLYAVDFSAHRGIHTFTREWRPLFTDALGSHLIYILLTAILVLLFVPACWKKRRTPLEYALVALTLCMEIYAVRFEVFFAIAAIPIIFGVEFRIAGSRKPAQLFGAAIAVLALVFVSWRLCDRREARTVADAHHPGLRVAELWSLPERIGNVAAQRVYCQEYGLCDVFLAGGASVYLDGRADPFPTPVWTEWDAVRHLADGWQRTLGTQRINVILATPKTPFAAALASDRNWRIAFKDADQIAFIATDFRRSPLSRAGRSSDVGRSEPHI